MTLPALIATHVHVSELETAHTWPDGQRDDAVAEDCVFTSGVELARLAFDPGIPATHNESEALRHDAGLRPLLGATAANLSLGLSRRYSKPGRIVASADVWRSLEPGMAVAALGSMAAFEDGSRWRRWDPRFAGLHAVLAVRTSGDDRVYWCDPLAPAGGRYQGEWMPGIDFRRYVNRGGLAGVVAPVRIPPSRIRVEPGFFFSYAVALGVIVRRRQMRTGGFTAACGTVREYSWPLARRTVPLVRIVGGAYDRMRINPYEPGNRLVVGG